MYLLQVGQQEPCKECKQECQQEPCTQLTFCTAQAACPSLQASGCSCHAVICMQHQSILESRRLPATEVATPTSRVSSACSMSSLPLSCFGLDHCKDLDQLEALGLTISWA